MFSTVSLLDVVGNYTEVKNLHFCEIYYSYVPVNFSLRSFFVSPGFHSIYTLKLDLVPVGWKIICLFSVLILYMVLGGRCVFIGARDMIVVI